MQRELKNGLYHAAGAIFALAPAAAFGGITDWTFAGFCYAVVREVTEEQLKGIERRPLSLEIIFDSFLSWKDYLGWTLGGLAIGVVVSVAA